MPASLSLHAVSVSRGARQVLSAVDLTISPGQRIGVVGPNGVGKSTLLAVAAGELAPDSGEVRRVPPSATVGHLRQEPQRTRETVREQLARRTGVTWAQNELDAATHALAIDAPGAAERYDLALHRWLALGATDLDARIGAVAGELGLSEWLLDQPAITLSGGEAARVGLAALLLSRFDVYLLDEPTNDLDLEGLARLEAWVLDTEAPMLIVSHDRRFLDRVVTDVVEIDEFTHAVTLFGGGWNAYRAERERARQHAWDRFGEYDSQRRSLAERAQRQREWAQVGQARVRRSANDEPDKNIRRFRTAQTEQLAGKAAQTQRAIDRLDTVDKPREPWRLELDIPTTGRSGDVVCRLSSVVVRHGPLTGADTGFQLGPLDLMLEYGERVALVGHNGAGKSTLIDLIVGRIDPMEGSIQRGPSVVVGEIEQVRAQLTGADTLLTAFQEATGLTVPEARTLLAKFGLVGDHVTRATASLSPGERTRAGLALLMANGANLLVLDEPTNHLDLPAIEQLEQALDTFGGTVLLVTHDRELLERVRITRTVQLANGRML
jgi:ATPase subunit of ABC transporter with duplicated ATPase domains